MKQVKKILLGSLVFALLSISITAIQMSCTKPAAASPSGVTGTPIGKLLYVNIAYNPTNSVSFIIADYNGNTLDSISNSTFADSLNFFNSNIALDYNSPLYPPVYASLSPDGKYLFFVAWNPNNSNISGIYRYDLNAHLLMVIHYNNYTTGRNIITLAGAY